VIRAGVDPTLYPDCDIPSDFDDDRVRADYIQRLCAAWDFGIAPDMSTIDLLSEWRSAIDAFPLPHSAAYHTLRWLYGLPHIDGDVLEANYERWDRREGRSDGQVV